VTPEEYQKAGNWIVDRFECPTCGKVKDAGWGSTNVVLNDKGEKEFLVVVCSKCFAIRFYSAEHVLAD
jgi:hypothetical protein